MDFAHFPVYLSGQSRQQENITVTIKSCICKLLQLGVCAILFGNLSTADPRVEALAKEVQAKGWIIFSARTESGDWDLYLSRPDGSQQLNLTKSPDRHEMGARFSPDGKKLLYRRLAVDSTFHHLNWGLQGSLVMAKSDGSHAVELGGRGDFPWASWSADGTQIACLYKDGIKIHDVETGSVVNKMPRQGIYQQLFWSPDGTMVCGPANRRGDAWGVVQIEIDTGTLHSVSGPSCCTGDWFPDSGRLIYSHRPPDQEVMDEGEMARRAGQKLEHGWTQLWMADKTGQHRRMVYGEDGRHIYGGAISPDGKYVLFTRSHEEDLKVMRSQTDQTGARRQGAPMALMRLSDAPAIGGESKALRRLHPETKDGPVLHLAESWEPHWTYSEVGRK